MTDKTLAALDASIAHWDDNAKAETPADASTGADACALCRDFVLKTCDGCPVASRAGRPFCNGTPYAEARAWFFKWCLYRTPKSAAAFRAAATAERDFLTETRQMYLDGKLT